MHGRRLFPQISGLPFSLESVDNLAGLQKLGSCYNKFAMNEDKNMTIDDLARLMQGEFLGVNKRFDGHDMMFAGINKRLDEHDKRFAGLESNIKEVKRDLTEVKEDVKYIKDNSNEIFTKIDKYIVLYEDQKMELSSMASQLKRLEERVLKLEGKNT